MLLFWANPIKMLHPWIIQNAWLRICHIWNDQEEERVIESSNDKLHAQFKISRLLFKRQRQKSCKLVMTRVKHARRRQRKVKFMTSHGRIWIEYKMALKFATLNLNSMFGHEDTNQGFYLQWSRVFQEGITLECRN